MNLEAPETPRTAGEATIVATVDGGEEALFTLDTTTTGNPYTAVERLLTAVKNDAQFGLYKDGRQDEATTGTARRRASAVVTVLVDGDRRRVALDTTTTGSPYAAAGELINAAVAELQLWCVRRGRGFSPAVAPLPLGETP